MSTLKPFEAFYTLTDPTRYQQYLDEIEASGLIRHIEQEQENFQATVHGVTYRNTPFVFGSIDIETGTKLYMTLRELKPEVAVETGVCNGVTTAFILLALANNQKGKLYSIDFPEVAGETYEDGSFWEGKGGAVIPYGKTPGWIIPESYKARWELTLGRSQDMLPVLLQHLQQIDFFIHDSEHSYDCMMFEYQSAFPVLRPSGLLASDDILWNTAFTDFAAAQGLTPNLLSKNLAFVTKPAHQS